ncbi:MAG: sulfurtransferase TusA family protein [Proteobacteria bacterium]|nr:sulfurtransferase TusA family protein [Pseudomonadota bacterium]
MRCQSSAAPPPTGALALTEKTMDLRGLKCPLPTLLVKKALTTLAPGDLIVAECTDPMAAIDIPHAVRESGDFLESKDRGQEHGTDLLTFRIRKK